MSVKNPFIVAGKISPRYFCDRKKESSLIIRKLVNGNNIVLISPRRMGKTGLISYCFESEDIKNNYIPIFIDILQTSSLKEFTFVLGRSVFQTLASQGKRYLKSFVNALKSLQGCFGFDPVSGSPTFNIELGDIRHSEITLEEIFLYLENADKRCLVAIDEFQQIGNYPEQNVESILRTHIQRCGNAHFIFAGSERHLMQRMFLSSERPFYQSADILELDAIPLEVYTSFALNNFHEFDKDIEVDAVKYVYDTFEGHTFYMQKALNEVFSYTEANTVADKKMTERAIDDMIDGQDTIYREILSTIPLKQKELLIAIARMGSVSAITSSEFIYKNRLSSASSVQSASRILLDKNLLTHSGNVYQIADRLLTLWLRRNYGSI